MKLINKYIKKETFINKYIKRKKKERNPYTFLFLLYAYISIQEGKEYCFKEILKLEYMKN